jgi:spore coat protein A
VDVPPYETAEVLVTAAGYRGRYLLHCHTLEHEDMAMMTNFDLTWTLPHRPWGDCRQV